MRSLPELFHPLLSRLLPDVNPGDDIEEEEDAAYNSLLVTTGTTYDDDYVQMLTIVHW